jgi:hypothetical protein
MKELLSKFNTRTFNSDLSDIITLQQSILPTLLGFNLSAYNMLILKFHDLFCQIMIYSAVELNSSVFWVVTRRTLVLYQCVGTIYRSHLQ